MKTRITALLMTLLFAFALVSCNDTEQKGEGLWASAVYTEDTVLGEGEKEVFIEVEADGKSVTFTVNTDAETLGEILREHSLAEGEETEYGLFIKYVNGIRADYDLDKGYYWASYKDGEYLMTGVDDTPVADGEHYELVRTK